MERFPDAVCALLFSYDDDGNNHNNKGNGHGCNDCGTNNQSKKMEECHKAIEQFLHIDGPPLQKLLVEYEQKGREDGTLGSYVEEFWSEAYLAPDQSVVLNLNPFFVLEVGYFNFYFYVVLFDFYLFLLRPQSIIEGAVFFYFKRFLFFRKLESWFLT